MTKTIKGSINGTYHDTPCTKALEGLDRDALLEKDVNRLCDELGTLEAGKVLSLGNKVLGAGNTNMHKKSIEELRSSVLKGVKRVEKKYGGLSLPKECRDLLINLV